MKLSLMNCHLCWASRGPFHPTRDHDDNGLAYFLCCSCRADRPVDLAERCDHLTTT